MEEPGMAYFKVVYQNLTGRTEDNHKKSVNNQMGSGHTK
jgi:hypothetical protein